MTRADVRAAFAAGQPFDFDDFQVQAMDAIDEGDSVLVAAPTGSGKTLVAEYAVAVAIAEGNKVFYTTPLKALSNQKFHDLVERHGEDKVGLLTGDNAVRPDAPAVVMTTEVLRNMIYAGSPALKNLAFVVLDEVHYLQNAYRGPVWEEVIIHAPPEVTLVCLSATVSNAEELTSWIQTVRGATVPIIEERRPVTLQQHYMVDTRTPGPLVMLDTFGGNGRANPQGGQYDNTKPHRRWQQPAPRIRYATPARPDVVERLSDEAMLPAIYFIFSRNACDDAVKQCINENVRLTTSDERVRIRAIAETATDSLSDEDLRILDYGNWLHALESGVAAHHAGLVPPFKEAVEACFAEALVKVVFATETLALGINMPARTVVIEKLSKFTGERHEFLTPGEYTQLTGRAGRRGIDDVGHSVVLWSPFVMFDQIASLASTRSYTLRSSFRPTYNMAANLVSHYPPDVARHLLNLSFAQYRSDADVVRLERQLEQITERITRAEERARCERGDVREWQRAREAPTTNDSAERIAAALLKLRIGDVIRDPGTSTERHVMIITTSQRRGHDLRLGVLNREGRRFSLVARDFTVAPHRLRHVELPKPFVPANKDFIKRAATSLRDGDTNDAPIDTKAETGPGACPDLPKHLDALGEVTRLVVHRNDIEQRVRGSADSLARQFDRVLALLRSLGYVDDWTLTAEGKQLRSVYHESDLLIVECLRRGVFDDLDPPEIAALASTFTYESRGPGGTGPTPTFRTKAVRDGWGHIESVWQQLVTLEADGGLNATRAPDSGFCDLAYAWVAGQELSDVLGDEEVSGGDFVRNVKQLGDLLRQLASVATFTNTAQAARDAAEELFRGIVAASSVMPGESSSSGATSADVPETDGAGT